MELLQANTGKGRRRIGLGWVEGGGASPQTRLSPLGGKQVPRGREGMGRQRGSKKKEEERRSCFCTQCTTTTRT